MLVDLFMFKRVKEELSGHTLFQEDIKKDWEGVSRTITVEEFAVIFRGSYDRNQKCTKGYSTVCRKLCHWPKQQEPEPYPCSWLKYSQHFTKDEK